MKKSIIITLTAVALLACHGASGQERRFEVGASVGIGEEFIDNKPSWSNYNAEVFGGYKINSHFVAGAGVGYAMYGGTYLDSGIEDNVSVAIPDYSGIRPFIYARYDFLPDKKWSPFVGVRLGYGFFQDSKFQFSVWSYGAGFGQDYSKYEYLRDLDQTLGVNGGLYPSIDIGVSRNLSSGSKITLALSFDCQYVNFKYLDKSSGVSNPSAGLKVGFIF